MEIESFTAIDLFCGSGAVTEGLKVEGFKVLAAVDNDPISCQTFRLNHPEVKLIQSDIRDYSAENLALELGLVQRLDLLVVCAPCQPFSSQNRKRAGNDFRSGLILESLKFIKAFLPRIVFFENVPGIAISGPIRDLSEKLSDLGYHLSEPRTIDAADCGVPQRRVRCIMLSAQFPSAFERFCGNIQVRARVSVLEAIGTLRPLLSGERDPEDPLHFARRHQSVVLERLGHIPKNGGSRSSLPKELQLQCHRGRINDFPDVYGRLSWDDVAPTLTTGCTDVTKGRFAHPRDDRAITLREAAMLQSFSVQYKFFGNSGQIARQIGNAVPVKMVRTLAPLLAECITEVRRNELIIKTIV